MESSPDLAECSESTPSIVLTDSDHAALLAWLQGAPLSVETLSEHLRKPLLQAITLEEAGAPPTQALGEALCLAFNGHGADLLARILRSPRPSRKAHQEQPAGKPVGEPDEEPAEEEAAEWKPLDAFLKALLEADGEDGARALNGVGPSRDHERWMRDTGLAASLARQEPIPRPLRAEALKVARFYHRTQMPRLGFTWDAIERAERIDLKALALAIDLLKDIGERAAEDKGAALEPEAIEAMRLVRDGDPPAWVRVRDALQKAKVPLRELERAMGPRQGGGGSSSSGEGPTAYAVEEGVLCRVTHDRDGVASPHALCNFNATITADEAHDDGGEVRRFFVVEGTLADKKPLPPATVPADTFGGMAWILGAWGTAAIVAAGRSTADHLRCAILHLSPEVKRTTLYKHTGWRRIDGEWKFLHAGGAIGRQGNTTEVSVSLEGRLGQYALELPSSREEMREAVRTSLSVLDLGPDPITVPVLMATYRAALCEAVPATFSVYCEGPTGSMKSCLEALSQGHFGRGWSFRNFPAAWSGTSNSIEALAFLAKDAILGIDDFAPRGSQDAQRLNRDADRLFRGAGNQHGRSRMASGGELRAERFPRGMMLASGEDLPSGHSLRARLLICSMSPGCLDKGRLTALQEASAKGTLAKAMGGFILWLAPRIDALKESAPLRLVALRDEIARGAATGHDRSPDTSASLLWGWELFLAFATDAGAITVEEAAGLMRRASYALGALAVAQVEFQTEEDPVGRFLDLIRACFVSGRAHLAGVHLELPANATEWGWESSNTVRPQGARIGWVDRDAVLLDPDAAYAAAQGMATAQGTSLVLTQRTLWRRMAERNLLAHREEGRQRSTIRRTIQGARREVVAILESAMRVSIDIPTVPTVPIDNKAASQASLPWDSSENGPSQSMGRPSQPSHFREEVDLP